MTVWTLALCSALVPLMSVLPVPLLPALPHLMHATSSATAWVLTSTLLSAMVSTPVAGHAGDLHGKRRALLGSLALLITGSMLGAITKSITILLVGRVLQGCAAGMLPLSAGILRDEMPADRLGQSLAVTSGAVGVTGAVAFPLGGLLAQHLGWHALFWAASAVGALAAGAVVGTVPAGPKPACRGGFDWRGTARLAAGSMLLVNVAAFLTGFAMYGLSVIIPQVFQAPRATGYGGGLSVSATGLCLAPAGLAMLLLSSSSARVSARSDPGVTLALGATFMALGYAAGIILPGGAAWYVAITVLVGGGLAFSFPAMSALTLAAVPATQSAAAGGVNLLIRSIGAAVASATLGAILGATTISTATSPASAPSPAHVRVAFAVAFCAAVGGAAVAALCTAIKHRDRGGEPGRERALRR